jgi:hypothetical protein
MLDTGYSIFRNALIVKSKNIQYQETSIKDQSIGAQVFTARAFIE